MITRNASIRVYQIGFSNITNSQEYDIFVQNDQINMEQVKSPRFVALANNTHISHGLDPDSTLAAVVNYMRFKWEAFDSVYVHNRSGVEVYGKLGDIGVVNFIEG